MGTHSEFSVKSNAYSFLFSACYHTKPYVCEDSDQLLDFVRASIRAKGADLEIPEPPEELEVDP